MNSHPNNPLNGVDYLFKGYRLLLSKQLRKWVLIPLSINVVLFTALIGGLGAWVDSLIARILPQGWEWLQWLIWPLFALLCALFAFYSFTLIANLIASPFNGRLAYRAAVMHGHTPDEPQRAFREEVIEALKGEAVKFVYYLKLVVPLLIVSFIPGINVLSPLLWMVFGAWMLAVEYADFPLGNEGMAPKAQREWLRAHRGQSLGFGAAVLGGTLIPIVNFAVVPAAVVGSTLWWVDRAKAAQRVDQ